MIRHRRIGMVDVWGNPLEDPNEPGGPPWRRIEPRFERETNPPGPGANPDAIERAWSAMCARNPRLFDGPITSITSFDANTMRFRWTRRGYKHLAVRPEIDTGARQLSATALLLAPDERGRRGVLLGRRSESVHTYPGLWEFGPSGGVDPPGSCEIDRAYLLDELGREIREEIGIEPDLSAARIVGIFRDARVGSYDALIRVDLDAAPDLPDGDCDGDWEYREIRWIPIEGFARAIEDLPEGLCPPSRAVATFLGWLGA